MSVPARIGPYRIIDRLGAGGMGEVFVAQRDGDTRLCALKRVRGEATPQLKSRLRREAHVATFLDHENVARVIDAGELDGMFCVASELVPGMGLEQLMYAVTLAGETFELDVVAKIVGDILAALIAAHEAVGPEGPLGIVHRDVAPKNVIVGFDGSSRLIDFGLVRAAIDDTRTQTGALMGTPAYIAPEQAVGERVDHRADIYATGLILFELLSSRRAVPDAPVPDMLRAAVAKILPPPSEYQKGLGPEIDRVVQRALEKNPMDRTASANEFLEGLFAALPEPAHRVKVAALVARFANKERKRYDRWIQALELDAVGGGRQQRTKVGPIVPLDEPATTAVETRSKPPRPMRATRKPYAAWGLGLAALSAACAAAVVYFWEDEPPTLPPVPAKSTPKAVARAAPPAPVVDAVEAPEPPPPPPPPTLRRPARSRSARPVKTRTAPPPRRAPARSKHWNDYDAIRAAYLQTRELDTDRTTRLVRALKRSARGDPRAEEAARKAEGCLRSCGDTEMILKRVKQALEVSPPAR